MPDNNDEKTLKRAREIAKKSGAKLVDAMLEAEAELTKPADIPSSFTVSIKVKPRVARWILIQFHANEHHTLEERLGAYLNTVLARRRVSAMRDLRDDPQLTDGRAVTLSRAAFSKQVSK